MAQKVSLVTGDWSSSTSWDDTTTTIRIYYNGVLYREHRFGVIQDVKALSDVLINDAQVDKDRGGQPA